MLGILFLVTIATAMSAIISFFLAGIYKEFRHLTQTVSELRIGQARTNALIDTHEKVLERLMDRDVERSHP